MNKIELGAKLKTLREKNGVSTYRLEKEGMNRTACNGIEDGSTSYTIDSLIRYCAICDIELEVK